MNYKPRTIFLAIVFALLLSRNSLAQSTRPSELWLYYPTNLQVNANVDQLEKIWRRAAAAGYKHVLLADSKFSHISTLPDWYFANVKRVQKIAADLHLQIVPAVFPIGYSNDLLFNDPNLAEGLPVKDTPFIVRDGIATIDSPPIALEKPLFADPNVAFQGHAAAMSGAGEHTRFTFALALNRFRCYRVSVSIRTHDLHAQPQIVALGGDQSLQYQNPPYQPTQDWKTVEVIFNTLDHDRVNLYFGVWDSLGNGTLEWKDWKIEEVGLLNVLRRDGTPCTVTGADGMKYVEGVDYQRIEDPKLGNTPYGGEYEFTHDPPAIHILDRRIADGTKLRVSWFHPVIIYDDQVCGCISDPGFIKLLATQARDMHKTWGDVGGWMMSDDEFRVCNWDDACQEKHETPGELLAANVRDCTKLLRHENAKEIYVWSDMFDPNHNAVKGPYYLVNGPWTGSWLGLDRDVIVVNWNYGKRDASLKWFADRGNRQIIAGYYDGGQSTAAWLASAAKVNGVIGIMYTTWRNDYSNLEKFAAEVNGGRNVKGEVTEPPTR